MANMNFRIFPSCRKLAVKTPTIRFSILTIKWKRENYGFAVHKSNFGRLGKLLAPKRIVKKIRE